MDLDAKWWTARGLIGGLLGLTLGATAEDTWFPFDPPRDGFSAESVFDLRHLNEAVAGDNGRIIADGAHFSHESTGDRLRFWSINIGPHPDWSMEQWRYLARLLAKYGFNQVRLHGGLNHGEQWGRPEEYRDRPNHEVSPYRIEGIWRAVAAMREQGIYTHLSIYFPYWVRFGPDDPDFPGYTGEERIFGTIFFNPKFQAIYRTWWEALLVPHNPHTGLSLIDDPAVMGAELINEDSLFFWTLGYQQIPLAQMALLEAEFGKWLVSRYGSVADAQVAWTDAPAHERDDWSAGRVGIVGHWEMKTRGSTRDFDQIRFFYETQRQTYEAKAAHLRALGFKGLITAGNWITSDDQKFDALERSTYLVGDFIDHHHAYYNGHHSGPDSAWALRDDHLYSNRSLLRLDPKDLAEPGRDYEIPFAKPTWNGMPSMVSETAWLRPNRFRTEAVPLYAAYGVLHGLDAIVHFVNDGSGERWLTKPQFHMQPWSWQTPTMMGQSPAAALIYRQGLVQEAAPATRVALKLEEQLRMVGMPYAPKGGIDNLRAANIEEGQTAEDSEQAFEPLRLFVAPMSIDIDGPVAETEQDDLARFISREERTVVSATDQLYLDWSDAVFRVDAPRAQVMVATRHQTEAVATHDLSFATDLDVFSLMCVALDERPIRTSRRILLQVMSEERNSGFSAEPLPDDPSERWRIQSVGSDPWEVRPLSGRVSLAGEPVRVTNLDLQGKPKGKVSAETTAFDLHPTTVYYLLERP